ncbi:MAG: SUMF1/EgtB/PvdO family nonheme iron enzyme [Bacteroidota bacterium]
MSSDNKYRYPGPMPFNEAQHDIFFGRIKDLEDLYRLVKLKEIVVLHGKSGIGKSSLINASFIKKVTDSQKYTPIKIRFFSYTENDEQTTPAEKTRKAIRGGNAKETVKTFLDKLIEHEDTIWHDIKELQITQKNSKGLVLIFDQFEELFSYPKADILRFEKLLSEALYTTVPERYWEALEDIGEKGVALEPHQIELFQRKPLVKVLFVIRFDKLHLLTKQFKDYITDVLSNPYELGDLSLEAAKAAIIEPAQKVDERFACEPFKYSEQALDQILSFLTIDGKSQIDSTHLQIVCQAIEQNQIQGPFKPVIPTINLDDLKQIIDDYYVNKIKMLGDERIQNVCKRLIEDKLIYPPEKRRLSLFKGVIAQFLRDHKVENPEQILQKLKESRLIREEPRENGIYYELSHDRLVDTVLKSKDAYEKEEQRKRREQYRKELREEKKKKERWRGLAIAVIIFGLLASISTFIAIMHWEEVKKLNDEILGQQQTLKSLIDASSSQMKFLFDDIELKIERLDYEGAKSKLFFANQVYKFDSSVIEKPPKKYFAELSFYYNEIGQPDSARAILNKMPYENIQLDSTQVDQGNIARIIETVSGPKLYGDIYHRYYPEMILVEGDSFVMGLDSALFQKYSRLVEAYNNEGETKIAKAKKIIRSNVYLKKYPHTVYLNSFYISRTEITIRQYDLYMKQVDDSIPEAIKKYYNGIIPSGELPMIEVSWEDAYDYTNWLNERFDCPLMDKREKVRSTLGWAGRYRLPTEAEWEFAAKEGVHRNEADPYIYSGSDNYKEVGLMRDRRKLGSDEEYIFPEKVMSRDSNLLGLYDMTGNVWEWCYDTYREEFDTSNILVNNPIVLERSEWDNRVLRGSSARSHFINYTNTIKYKRNKKLKEEIYGFRIVRMP